VFIEAETRRSAMFEERDRMTRDIHDGIGGQLLSLLMRVRAGGISRDEMEQELQGGLNDLRMIVDSLDHSDISLGVALATFHSRLRLQLDAAGIALHWLQDEADLPDAPDPRVVLNISRILQEALTNVVRHSRATEVHVTISGSRDPASLDVVVRDNGVGWSTTPRPGGRGLANMTRRADDLGASLMIENNPETSGTRVCLHVPIIPRLGESTRR
jgi:signal transduction histidine kinase